MKQSDCVSFISLAVTGSLLGKLSAIERPLWQLEDPILLSRDIMQPTLPGAFHLCLHCLHMVRITFTSLQQLLFSSKNLVYLHLHDILNPRHLSPEILVNAWSGMTRLRLLSLLFPFSSNHISISPPSWKRVVLPALTRLNFRGIAKYLEDLVARIDAPRLGDIEVTIHNESFFELSKLSEFINRTEMHKSHRRAVFYCLSMPSLSL